MGSAFFNKGVGISSIVFFVIIIIWQQNKAIAGRRATWVMGFWVSGKSEIPWFYGLGLEGSNPWRNSLMGRHGHDGMGILGGGGALSILGAAFILEIPTSTCEHTTHRLRLRLFEHEPSRLHTPHHTHQPRRVGHLNPSVHSCPGGTTVKFPSASIAGRRTGIMHVPLRPAVASSAAFLHNGL